MRQVQHHRAVLADGIQHHRLFALGHHLAHDVDGLGLEPLQVGQVERMASSSQVLGAGGL